MTSMRAIVRVPPAPTAPRWSPRRAVLLATVLVAAQAPAGVAAQERFEDLALRIDLGDRVRVTDSAGRAVAGRLTGLTPDLLTLRAAGGEARFERGAIRAVAVARPAFRRRAAIGAGVLALLGAATMCAHGEDDCLLVGTLGAAPLGAGIGLTVAALAPRLTTIHRTPAGQSPAPAGEPSGGFLADLALRADLDDVLQVDDASGVRTSGRLTALTADRITLGTAAGERQFPRDEVRRVTVRRPRLRAGVLVGAGAGAVAAAVAACTGEDRDECVDAPLMAGALGAVVGLGLGALLPRTVVAYPVTDRASTSEGHVHLQPVVRRESVGVRVCLTW